MNNQPRPQRSATPKRPDWILCYKRKDAPRGTHATKFGAGWENQFGGINITLDHGCKFPDTSTCWVSLWRTEEDEWAPPLPSNQPPRRSEQQPQPPTSPPSEDDYMERKRKERQRQQPPPPTSAPTNDDDDLGPSFLR